MELRAAYYNNTTVHVASVQQRNNSEIPTLLTVAGSVANNASQLSGTRGAADSNNNDNNDSGVNSDSRKQ